MRSGRVEGDSKGAVTFKSGAVRVSARVSSTQDLLHVLHRQGKPPTVLVSHFYLANSDHGKLAMREVPELANKLYVQVR